MWYGVVQDDKLGLCEILVFRFCFFDMLTMAPSPNVIMDMVQTLQSSWFLYNALTYHLTNVSLSVFSTRGKYTLPHTSFMIFFSFHQSSSPGLLNLVIMNATYIYVSCLVQLNTRRIYVTTL